MIDRIVPSDPKSPSTAHALRRLRACHPNLITLRLNLDARLVRFVLSETVLVLVLAIPELRIEYEQEQEQDWFGQLGGTRYPNSGI